MPFRKWFITGLIVLLPIVGTFMVINWLIRLSDRALALLPEFYQPETLLGIHIPGMGIIFALLFIVLIGMLATNFFGKRLLVWFDSILARVPVVRSIYGAIKQLLEAVVGSRENTFRQVVLVSFPQAGQWSIGFVTGSAKLPLPAEEVDGLVTVFVPTTPNPTSGWLLFVPEEELKVLPMSVEDGMKMVVSGGIISPESEKILKP
ncbi:MAG: DUF502 domain-containing protein [Mariprofundaceae bacterium]